MVEPVRRSLTVAAPQERAFAVFTEGLGLWWPLDRYAIGAQPAVTAVMEPREGGRWFERAADGSECDWGRVVAWEPPERVVLTWEIDAEWQPNPDVASEVEIRFVADGERATRVELEHRGLEAIGAQAAQMRAIFDSPGGWAGLLAAYGERAAQPAEATR